MLKLETDYKKVDWVGVKNDFLEKMRLLQIAWQASQKNCDASLHAKLVEDIYVPALSKVGEFCACIDEMDEDKDGKD